MMGPPVRREMALTHELRAQLLALQRNEITEYHIYRRLAGRVKSPDNRKVLNRIGEEERGHYDDWKRYTGRDVEPDRFRIWKYVLIGRLFGLTFGIKLMERGEVDAQDKYSALEGQIPEVDQIVRDERDHEDVLIEMLDEELLRYVGSIVLGLNDALVELTGALAGLTLALQNTTLIALTGVITGIAAALSMGASEYLSTKSEETVKNPLRASIYTGTTYMVTVFLLILPYLVLANYFICLAVTLAAAVAIIALFNYYVAIAQDRSFRRRFLEMAGISLGVAGFSFAIGYLVRAFLGVEA
jgi:VIT1/CCC1 family predicted Fe2+/Mn2+ transporter